MEVLTYDKSNYEQMLPTGVFNMTTLNANLTELIIDSELI